MRIYLTISVICFALNAISCKDKKQHRQYKAFEKNGFIVKGYVINDTLFDDTVYYYNSENVLLQKEVYANGKLNGISEEFYNNRKIKTQTAYSNGLKNGVNLVYDSIGRCTYSDYYYYDLSVGPVVYYDTSSVAKRFFFISFDNRTLLDIDYASWKGVNDFVMKFINYSYEIQKLDSVQQASLFLYIIKPPQFLTKYTLYKRSRSNNNEQIFVTNLSTDQPFIDFALPILSDDYYYSIQLDIYDSIMHKRSIINREVW